MNPSPDIYVTEGDHFGQWFIPVPMKDVQKGTFLMINNGKHGHSKIAVTGIGLFTGTKENYICPSNDNMMVPTVNRIPYICQGVSDEKEGYFLLWDDTNGVLREDFPFRPNQVDLHRKIYEQYHKIFNTEGDYSEICVTILQAPLLLNEKTEKFQIYETIESFK